MPYESLNWKQTHRNRTDLTGLLTHLTRRQEEYGLNSTDVLIKILNERTLRASSKGYIVGNKPVVCFQEVPLYSVAENAILHVEEYESMAVQKLRYDACGLVFHKSEVSQLVMDAKPIPDMGVRPVIYERTELAKQFLPDNEYWRIVDFDIRELIHNGKITDWTHEREWRVPCDILFNYSSITVLLRNTYQYQEFMYKINHSIVNQLGGIVILEKLLY
ncbi:DUF2971 domain-containing protein [Halobacillus litoralis]|uniref:DUF2971 domain-containing protein n=1 Tax=Halobacillus litoralis TaxID=45668 RepID=UPI00136CD58E|nr:DUF2971 domain-containing protein [Halobacillus litoralis]MYL37357.1 DUF2971 domain-containing protein [Halobacillus litoralis]